MQTSAAARATLSRWYWAMPYLAVTVLALSMLAVVWLLRARETAVERDALARDLQWTEQSIRRAMLTTEEFLVQLARDLSAGTLDHDDFQLRANAASGDQPRARQPRLGGPRARDRLVGALRHP